MKLMRMPDEVEVITRNQEYIWVVLLYTQVGVYVSVNSVFKESVVAIMR